jgi:HSP20 family molecular chaperone IbpA
MTSFIPFSSQVTSTTLETGSNQMRSGRRFSSKRTRASETGAAGAHILGKELPPIEWDESDAGHTILVPMHGIDLRHIYVVAGPDSILIDMKVRKTVKHEDEGPLLVEIRDQRISRELKFRHTIQKGATVVRVRGEALEITCRKATQTEESNSWSELLRFDTRSSLGCV